MGLLKANVYAATDVLDTEEGVKFFSEKAAESGDFMPEIYFFIRRPISDKYKSIFRRLARQSILKLSLKITSRGIRGQFKKTVPYYQIGIGVEQDGLFLLLKPYYKKTGNTRLMKIRR